MRCRGPSPRDWGQYYNILFSLVWLATHTPSPNSFKNFFFTIAFYCRIIFCTKMFCECVARNCVYMLTEQIFFFFKKRSKTTKKWKNGLVWQRQEVSVCHYIHLLHLDFLLFLWIKYAYIQMFNMKGIFICC